MKHVVTVEQRIALENAGIDTSARTAKQLVKLYNQLFPVTKVKVSKPQSYLVAKFLAKKASGKGIIGGASTVLSDIRTRQKEIEAELYTVEPLPESF